jgi:hypothetical protein
MDAVSPLGIKALRVTTFREAEVNDCDKLSGNAPFITIEPPAPDDDMFGIVPKVNVPAVTVTPPLRELLVMDVDPEPINNTPPALEPLPEADTPERVTKLPPSVLMLTGFMLA